MAFIGNGFGAFRVGPKPSKNASVSLSSRTFPLSPGHFQSPYMSSAPKLSRRAALSLIPALALVLQSTEALADHTVIAARRSYDRYHPRILAAIETIRKINTSVGKGDAEGAASLINDKLFSIKARRAFSIYATSFSDNYLGAQSREMLKNVDGMYSELELVATGADMAEHFGAAVEKLEAYYSAARLPTDELAGLRM